jgi:hypothetical protein
MIPHAVHTHNLTKSLLNLALLGVIAAAILTSFLQGEHVAFKYKSFVQSATNLTGGQTGVPGQYDTAWQKLKSKSEVQIRDNDRKIEQIKTQRAKASKGFRATYDRRVTELERRNIVLNARLNDYQGYRGENMDGVQIAVP